MQHFWSLSASQLSRSWLTIGSFDGVHRGHQAIVRQLVSGAHSVEAPAVVLTFYPHPAYILGKRSEPLFLTTPEARVEYLRELRVDAVITHPFTLELAKMGAEEFVRILKEQLGMEQLLVGHDFALGRQREGDLPTLRRLGSQYAFRVDEIEPVQIEGKLVSSSEVRALLAEGQVEKAAGLLGRPYRVGGRVVAGDQRGRLLGIPTANLSLWKWQAFPVSGVYACRAWVGGESHLAVANIGVRPTFTSDSTSIYIEAHLLDFDREVYDMHLQLDFLARLRDEMRFPNKDALVEQIHRDIARAREMVELAQ
jgi:riboflavin kinase / FMN adenylyltransferase